MLGDLITGVLRALSVVQSDPGMKMLTRKKVSVNTTEIVYFLKGTITFFLYLFNRKKVCCTHKYTFISVLVHLPTNSCILINLNLKNI